MKNTSSDRTMRKAFRAKHVALLLRMQTPKARKGMQAAFNAAPAQLGRVAVRAKRKSC